MKRCLADVNVLLPLLVRDQSPIGNRIACCCSGVSESQTSCGIEPTSRLLSAYQGRT